MLGDRGCIGGFGIGGAGGGTMRGISISAMLSAPAATCKLADQRIIAGSALAGLGRGIGAECLQRWAVGAVPSRHDSQLKAETVSDAK